MNKHTQPNPESLIQIGELKKPYGIKGWLWVFSHLDNRPDIFEHQPWWIKTATGYKPLDVMKWREQGSGLVASFEQVPDRNVAETMHGVAIWVEKDTLSDTEDDEYLWSDLEGLTVINAQNEVLGKVKSLFDTGAHSILEVEPTTDSIDSEPRLIPWHEQTIIDVFLDKQEIHVDWEADF